MKYKLIAMDLDGTLNNDRKTIDPPTRDALLAAQAAGVRLLLASARPLPGLYKERDLLDLASHRGLLMAYNGGTLADAGSGERLCSFPMDAAEARWVLLALEALPVTPILDDGVRFYVADRNGYKVQYECANNRMACVEIPRLAEALDFAPFKILMSVQPREIKAVQAKIAALLPPQLAVVQTAAFYLEVIPRSIDKGRGLRSACDALGIDPAETIAFGDSENDIPMLRAAGTGVAMANASEEVKAAADWVTLSNNENGIAAALHHFGALPDA
ncbi:MAG: Cof-type HAD-IIB family hydrolase [Clostridia bacterium]|nr:Cof-type HAD-IIB family hydrolase [Clostridia bacterium]